EDGIRDKLVTGVQTCALPIYRRQTIARFVNLADPIDAAEMLAKRAASQRLVVDDHRTHLGFLAAEGSGAPLIRHRSPRHYCVGQIGRASCRERGWVWVGGVAV